MKDIRGSITMDGGPGSGPHKGEGGAKSPHEDGDRVKIRAGLTNGGKTGHVSTISGGGYHGVTSAKGEHLGYFHHSDLSPAPKNKFK
jgi:hypothetical protein